jgi:hypothetical protein
MIDRVRSHAVEAAREVRPDSKRAPLRSLVRAMARAAARAWLGSTVSNENPTSANLRDQPNDQHDD